MSRKDMWRIVVTFCSRRTNASRTRSEVSLSALAMHGSSSLATRCASGFSSSLVMPVTTLRRTSALAASPASVPTTCFSRRPMTLGGSSSQQWRSTDPSVCAAARLRIKWLESFSRNHSTSNWRESSSSLSLTEFLSEQSKGKASKNRTAAWSLTT